MTGGAAGEPAAERLGASVWRLALASRTLPPFDTTNTYLIVDAGVGVIVDPGFDAPAELERLRALANVLGVRLMKGVLLTHSHRDHCAGLEGVLAAFDRPAVYIHPAELGRLEGRAPLHALGDGRTLTVGDVLVRAVHTPGHSPGHLSFALPEEGTVLAGDLVAGRGSSWVGLPEGDVAAYLASLERLRALAPARLGPGHGPTSDAPTALLAGARDHRLGREAQLLDALDETRSLDELRTRVYGELDPGLHTAAEASLLAHLQKLMAEMKVLHLGDSPAGPYRRRR